MLTKANARSLIRELADDPNAKLWSNANLDALASATLDDLWATILSVAPWATSQLDTITTLASPGYVDLRLTTGGGDLTQRLYRLQTITRDDQSYGAIQPSSVTLQAGEVKASDNASYAFFVWADRLYLFPLDTTTDVEVRYSYLPTPFTTLNEGDTVGWPDGFDAAYTHEVAARAMLRGAREDPAGLRAIAAESFNRLLGAVSRQHLGPTTPILMDSPLTWGSS